MSNPKAHTSRLHDYLELIRLPNVFTAIADSAMGVLFVRADERPGGLAALVCLPLASALLYAGGMALNDAFDADEDARERPNRPIPSGRVALQAARRLAGLLLSLGLASAGLVALAVGQIGPLLVAVLLVAMIVAYDARLKHTPLGPVAMGLCRMLNVMLGFSAAGAISPACWLVAGAIGIYITGVTWFARTEASASRRVPLALATVLILAGPALLGLLPGITDNAIPALQQEPGRWYALMAVLAALIGWRCASAIVTPTPVQVQVAVINGILSLVVLDAACCFAVRDVLPATAIILLLLPAVALSQRFRPT